jgi:hypothetical protein
MVGVGIKRDWSDLRLGVALVGVLLAVLLWITDNSWFGVAAAVVLTAWLLVTVGGVVVRWARG